MGFRSNIMKKLLLKIFNLLKKKPKQKDFIERVMGFNGGTRTNINNVIIVSIDNKTKEPISPIEVLDVANNYRNLPMPDKLTYSTSIDNFTIEQLFCRLILKRVRVNKIRVHTNADFNADTRLEITLTDINASTIKKTFFWEDDPKVLIKQIWDIKQLFWCDSLTSIKLYNLPNASNIKVYFYYQEEE